MPGDLTLQQAADTLGVHYMTVYRYVRLGLLPAERAGRAWAVRRDDLDAFVAERRAGSGIAARGTVDWAGRLERRLRAGDGSGAKGVLDGALASGCDPADVYVDVVGPAMRDIGDAWAAGELTVAEEHRASVITGQMLALLDSRFTRRGVRRGVVLLGCAPEERHALALRLVASTVRQAGWEVEDLGADVPAEELAGAAAAADRLVAVGISTTTPGNERAVTRAVDAVRGAVDVPVLVGGGAVTDEDWARHLGGDAWAADARGVVDVLEAVHAG